MVNFNADALFELTTADEVILTVVPSGLYTD
jgi:hypothetical protein